MSVVVEMPSLSKAMETGKVVEWRKKEGSKVKKGEIILIVETEKVKYEVESPGTGILHILVAEDEEVAVGVSLGIVAHDAREYTSLLEQGQKEVRGTQKAAPPSSNDELIMAPRARVEVRERSAPTKVRLVVIGGGPGGYPAAIRAAQMGARVTLIEKTALGGTCLNCGCIPTKALLHSAELLNQARGASSQGIRAEKVSLDFPKAMQWKNKAVRSLLTGLGSIVKSNGIRVIKGMGTLVDPHLVRVNETAENISTDKIIIATGSVPLRIPIEGAELPGVITSDEALRLRRLPRRILIIGGGMIGVEFAQIFRRMAAGVTLVEMLPRILPNEDAEMVNKLRGVLEKEGIEILTNTRIREIKEAKGGNIVALGNKKRRFDAVLLASGRVPWTEGLGVESIGIKKQKGFVTVDKYLKTNVPDIYAVGDVIGNQMLAHVAMCEGERAAQNALGLRMAMNYKAVPRVLYTSPELASVGLTEEEAKQTYGDIKVGKYSLLGCGKAVIMGTTGGMVKVIAKSSSKEVVGVHILGPHAGELIAEAVLGIQLGATLTDFGSTMHAHPTLAESIREAALDAEGRAIHASAKKQLGRERTFCLR